MLAGHDDAATQALAIEPDSTERMEASLYEVPPPPASCGPRPLGESVAAESEPAGAMEVEVEVVPSEEDEPTDGVEVVEDCEHEQIVMVGCEQLVLQKSALNATGYLCVVRSERDGLYRVESASYAGISFPTARAAAVAYARIIAAEDESEPELDEDEIARIVQAAEEEVARGDDGCARAREMVRQPVDPLPSLACAAPLLRLNVARANNARRHAAHGHLVGLCDHRGARSWRGRGHKRDRGVVGRRMRQSRAEDAAHLVANVLDVSL